MSRDNVKLSNYFWLYKVRSKAHDFACAVRGVFRQKEEAGFGDGTQHWLLCGSRSISENLSTRHLPILGFLVHVLDIIFLLLCGCSDACAKENRLPLLNSLQTHPLQLALRLCPSHFIQFLIRLLNRSAEQTLLSFGRSCGCEIFTGSK